VSTFRYPYGEEGNHKIVNNVCISTSTYADEINKINLNFFKLNRDGWNLVFRDCETCHTRQDRIEKGRQFMQWNVFSTYLCLLAVVYSSMSCHVNCSYQDNLDNTQ